MILNDISTLLSLCAALGNYRTRPYYLHLHQIPYMILSFNTEKRNKSLFESSTGVDEVVMLLYCGWT